MGTVAMHVWFTGNAVFRFNSSLQASPCCFACFRYFKQPVNRCHASIGMQGSMPVDRPRAVTAMRSLHGVAPASLCLGRAVPKKLNHISAHAERAEDVDEQHRDIPVVASLPFQPAMCDARDVGGRLVRQPRQHALVVQLSDDGVRQQHQRRIHHCSLEACHVHRLLIRLEVLSDLVVLLLPALLLGFFKPAFRARELPVAFRDLVLQHLVLLCPVHQKPRDPLREQGHPEAQQHDVQPLNVHRDLCCTPAALLLALALSK